MPATFAGRPFLVGGTTYIIAPLKLSQFWELEADLNRMRPEAEEPAHGGERFKIMARVVAMALSRNHPEMTEDQVADLFDLGNIEGAFEAALAVGGLVATGEAMPAENGSTSPASSTDSPSPTAGATTTSAN